MRLIRLPARRPPLALIYMLGAFLTACAPDASDPGESNDPEGTVDQELVSSCTASRILADAPAGRRAILERGLRWVSLRVMYSQTRYFEGYRQDCSGFVSMCWGLPRPGPWTGILAPASTTYSHAISWGDLQPGDALNDPAHHVMMFAGWIDRAHTQMCIVQENRTGTPANVGARSRSSIVGYTPIRFNRLPPGAFEGPPPPDPHCPATGNARVCYDGDTVAACVAGQIDSRTNCGAGTFCSTAGAAPGHCVSSVCVATRTTVPRDHDVCLADGRIAHCTSAGLIEPARACAAGGRCVTSGATSHCEALPPPPPTPPADSGVGAPPTDAGPMIPPTDASGSMVPPPADAGTVVRDAGPSSTLLPCRTDGGPGSDGSCGASPDHGIYGGMQCSVSRPASRGRGTKSAIAGAMVLVAIAAARRRRRRD